MSSLVVTSSTQSSANGSQALVPKEIPLFFPALTIEVLTDDAEFNLLLKENPADNASYASMRSNFWYVAKVAVFVVYAILAAAAVVLSGLFFPVYIPIATLAVLSLLPLVYKGYESSEEKSDLAAQISRQENGIATKLKELEKKIADKSLDLPTEIARLTKDAGITLSFKAKDGSLSTEPFDQQTRDKGLLLLLARHLYWKEEGERCMAAAAEHFVKAIVLEEGISAKDAPEAKEVSDVRRKLNEELENWYEMTFKASLAKTETVFTRYLLSNPYHKKEREDSCTLHHCPRHYYYIGSHLAGTFGHAVPMPMEAVRFKDGPAVDLIKQFSLLLRDESRPIFEAYRARDEKQFKEACKAVGEKIASPPQMDRGLLYCFAEPNSVEKSLLAEERSKDLTLSKLPPQREIADPTSEWTFPSQHLPIGARINGRTFASWDLTSNDQAAKQETLVKNIGAMMVGESKKSFIALQNCTDQLLDALPLPSGYGVAKFANNSVALFDTAIFTKKGDSVFTDTELGREYLISLANFSNADETGKESLKAFADLRKQAKQHGQTALFLGNMNCSPLKLVEALQTGQYKAPYALHPYPTTWKARDGGKTESIAASQIWIGTPKGVEAEQVKRLRPEELVEGAAQALMSLLKPPTA